MTFIEQYSLALSRFIKEHLTEKEVLREMIFLMMNPSRDYGPGTTDLVCGNAHYKLLQVQGNWEIRITDKSGVSLGDITFNSPYLLNADEKCVRSVVYDLGETKTVTDITLINILLDNY